MRSDRYRNVVLTVIAVTLVVIALPRLEPPEVMAASGQPAAAADRPAVESELEQQDGVVSGTTERATTPGPAPLPLRWHVDFAVEQAGIADTYCTTSIYVRNVTSAGISAQIEWFDWNTGSLGYTEQTVPAGSTRSFMADFDVPAYPFVAGNVVGLDDFWGYASVHADDPRVHVSAYVICRDGTIGTTSIVGMTQIGTSPVGATMEFFQAGMPATWTPPMAVPEIPE